MHITSLGPAHDQLRTSLNQLKPAGVLQNVPNQHMLFFSTWWTICPGPGFECGPESNHFNGEGTHYEFGSFALVRGSLLVKVGGSWSEEAAK